MEQMNYASPLFVRSRRAYSTQCMLEYFIALLVSDAFLSKLLTVLGLSDAQVGVMQVLATETPKCIDKLGNPKFPIDTDELPSLLIKTTITNL